MQPPTKPFDKEVMDSARAEPGEPRPDRPVDWAVSAADTRIWEDDFHVLHVAVGDQVFDDVRPRRLFPISGKAGYVGFLGEKDTEVVLLADPDQLDDKSAEALEAALARTYYAPKVLQVFDIEEAMGISLWHVRTEQGLARFEVIDRQRNIRILPQGRLLIVDVDGNRFEIDDVTGLDPRSQALIATET
jgi:hypothetical protein